MIGAALLALAAGPASAEPLSYAEAADYFAVHTGGAIGPAVAVPPAVSFEKVTASPERLQAIDGRAPWLNQGLFELDVQVFTERAGQPDFLAAKRAFYGDLEFLPHEQVHAREFAYLDAWQELFHPPVQQLELPLSAYHDLFPPHWEADSPFFDPAFQRGLDEVSGTELSRGNELELLASDLAYDVKLRLVREAEQTLFVSMMFFGCDDSSDALADAMAERVEAGVDVRVLTEAVYRSTLSRRCMDRLLLRGVKVATVTAATKARTRKAVLHQKVWIRDGEELVIGGSNVLDYENLGNGFDFMDRDTDLWVRGPLVADATEAFLESWALHGDGSGDAPLLQAVRDRKRAEREAGERGPDSYARWLGDPELRMQGVCRVAMQGLMAEDQPIAPLIEAHLEAMVEQVVFVAPAFFIGEHGSDQTRIGRVLSVLEGRDEPDDPRVVIISNGTSGGAGELGIWLQRQQYRSGGFAARLLGQYHQVVSRRAGFRNRAGALALQQVNPQVEVWMYLEHIHSKTWLFDRHATVVGSWNLDHNSGDLNYEHAVVCLDDGLREAMERDLTLALINSVPVLDRSEP